MQLSNRIFFSDLICLIQFDFEKVVHIGLFYSHSKAVQTQIV
jgi:hypothetical protein